MSLVVWPSAISWTISRCRPVSCSSGVFGQAIACREVLQQPGAISFPRYISPLTTRSTAAPSSATAALLKR